MTTATPPPPTPALRPPPRQAVKHELPTPSCSGWPRERASPLVGSTTPCSGALERSLLAVHDIGSLASASGQDPADPLLPTCSTRTPVSSAARSTIHPTCPPSRRRRRLYELGDSFVPGATARRYGEKRPPPTSVGDLIAHRRPSGGRWPHPCRPETSHGWCPGPIRLFSVTRCPTWPSGSCWPCSRLEDRDIRSAATSYVCPSTSPAPAQPRDYTNGPHHHPLKGPASAESAPTPVRLDERALSARGRARLGRQPLSPPARPPAT